MRSLQDARIGVIGLGYVGLPLSVEFGKHYPTVGFDIKKSRVAELESGNDSTLETTPEELKAAKGRVTFRVYCSNCHGADAKGDGKLAPLLSVKPADLTRLITKKDRGEFPAERVRQSIDGRAEVAGHGYREMPVWGDVFQPMDSEMSEPEKVDVAKRKIAELVAYLRTLQASAEEGGG